MFLLSRDDFANRRIHTIFDSEYLDEIDISNDYYIFHQYTSLYNI